MKRGPMLFCANVDEPRFKVLRQRGQLPFDPPAGDGYTMDHAFRLRLMLDLIGGEDDGLGGLSPSAAAPLVAEALRRAPQHPLQQISPGDWHAGVVVLERELPGGEVERWSETYVGDLDAYPAWVAEKRRFVASGSTPDLPKYGTFRVVRHHLVSVTRAADFVQDRGEELGITPEASE